MSHICINIYKYTHTHADSASIQLCETHNLKGLALYHYLCVFKLFEWRRENIFHFIQRVLLANDFFLFFFWSSSLKSLFVMGPWVYTQRRNNIMKYFAKGDNSTDRLQQLLYFMRGLWKSSPKSEFNKNFKSILILMVRICYLEFCKNCWFNQHLWILYLFDNIIYQ